MPLQHLTKHLLSDDYIFRSSKAFRRGFLWEVEKKYRGGEACPKCGLISKARSGICWVTIKDEPFRERPFYLRIKKHRYMCKSCRKPFTETAPGVYPRRRTTQRFRRTLAEACLNFVNLSRVRTKYKCSSALVYQVFYEQLEIKLRERSNWQWPETLCIDEHFFSRAKGYTKFVTMFADLGKKRLFDMAIGKDKKSLDLQMSQIPGRENVRFVVMDMSSTYRSFIKEFFPNAKIVADKFHVLRLLSPAIIRHRKNIHGHKQELYLRRRLLMNRKNLDYHIRCDLDRYLQNHPHLQELYRYKERLHELYRIKGFDRAAIAFQKLIEQMNQSQLPEIIRLKKTLKTWAQEILNYFKTGFTNGLVEALNNTGKLVQKQAYGYKSFRNYRLRTLSACF